MGGTESGAESRILRGGFAFSVPHSARATSNRVKSPPSHRRPSPGCGHSAVAITADIPARSLRNSGQAALFAGTCGNLQLTHVCGPARFLRLWTPTQAQCRNSTCRLLYVIIEVDWDGVSPNGDWTREVGNAQTSNL